MAVASPQLTMNLRTRTFPLLAALLLSLPLHAHNADPLKGAATAPAPNAPRESVSGTVHELLIEDHVAQMSVRYLTLVPQAGAAVALSGTAADALAAGASAEVVGRRNGSVLFVESAKTVAAAATKAAPADTTVEGDLAVAHADDFETGRSEYLYEVHERGGQVTRLALAVRPEALQAGMHVAAHGRRDASDQLDPTRIEVLALPPADTASDATTATSASTATGTDTTAAATSTTAVVAKTVTGHTVLVIPVKFSDTASDPLPIASVQNVMTGATNSVANFFREVSYGQHVMNVTVPSQWLRSATMATPSTCSYTAIATAGDAAAAAAGYTVSNYQFRVYMFPRVSACGWSGLAYIGNPKQAWINGAASVVTQVVGHEMGHNFGLLHAASRDCGTLATGGTCTVSEYGDPFNTMGNSRSMHYDAAQKSLLGWIPSTSVKTHASGSASYTLAPLEVAGGSVYAVKIPAATNRTYWLEYRQPVGFDAPLASYPNNGVQVRVASPFESQCSGCGAYSDDTQFIDMTPATSAFSDGTLVAGSSFTDTQYGITINVISATASALTVQVSAPGGSATLATTTTTVASAVNPAAAGTAVAFTASVSGSAPGGTVTFTDNGATVAACSAVALAGTGSVRTAACTTSGFAAGSHAIVARYSGDAANAASTSAALTETVTTTAGTSTNVALASAGGVATASSTYSTSFPVSAVNNNDRKGGTAGRWKDGTSGTWPDWVQIAFNGSKTIDHVVVYSVQDNYTSPVEPTATMTFSLYGLKSFQVQGWNGSSWVTLGSVTGNNLVKRTVTFTPYTTSKIRVNITGASDGWSRATEIEAWGN